MNSFVVGLMGCVALLWGSNARAWGPFGHMVVASVAWEQLTPRSREKVSELLKLNPQYRKWVDGVPKETRDEYAFMAASNWADDIKGDAAFSDESDWARGPDAERNLGYDDKLRHRYWHYVNIAFSPDRTALRAPDGVNVQSRIREFRQTLQSPTASAMLKSYDLVWLIHLVGDAHQPLHATARFTAAAPQGDRGGNTVIVCSMGCAEETKQTLHEFWDDLPGKPERRGKVRAAALELPPAPTQAAAISDERLWLEESFNIAKRRAYAPPITAGNGPFVLSESYKADAAGVARERVALAGARLARLIEESL